MTIRLLLVEDQTIVRMGLRRLLETVERFQVVGEAETESEAVELARLLRPDVILMDLRLGEQSGLRASRQILAEERHAQILALTSYDDYPIVEEAIGLGMLGYAPKQITLRDLCEAIDVVNSGKQYIHPSTLQVLLKGIRHYANGGHMSRISPSVEEKALLEMLAEGLSFAEMGARIFVSERTVRRHVQVLFDRLEVSNAAQAVALAVRQGWL